MQTTEEKNEDEQNKIHTGDFKFGKQENKKEIIANDVQQTCSRKVKK